MPISYQPGFADLIAEIKSTRDNLDQRDVVTVQRFDRIETSINNLYKKTQRPGFSGGDRSGDDLERKDAADHCVVRHNLTPRNEGGGTDYMPSSDEINDAMLARKALRGYIRHGDNNRLGQLERKSLSSFSFGNVGWIVSPQMSNQVLSCLVDPSDLAGLMNRVPISGASIKFSINNARLDIAAWACETSCFANNRNRGFESGVGRARNQGRVPAICCLRRRLACR